MPQSIQFFLCTPDVLCSANVPPVDIVYTCCTYTAEKCLIIEASTIIMFLLPLYKTSLSPHWAWHTGCLVDVVDLPIMSIVQWLCPPVLILLSFPSVISSHLLSSASASAPAPWPGVCELSTLHHSPTIEIKTHNQLLSSKHIVDVWSEVFWNTFPSYFINSLPWLLAALLVQQFLWIVFQSFCSIYSPTT